MAKFSIGDVVTFKTHPFDIITKDVLISGEYSMIPPLMVITEIIDNSVLIEKDIHDKYACIWYSTKENTFKDGYFPEPELKQFDFPADVGSVDISVGDLVTLKTMPIELGKRRSFLQTETDSTFSKSTNSITALLSFVSPVMLVVAIDPFDPSKDKSTPAGVKPKKTYPETAVKCKWFNSVSEKFSERHIAINALSKLPNLKNNLISLFSDSILHGNHLTSEGTIIKPKQISNRSGLYFITFFDYIKCSDTTASFLSFKALPETIEDPIKRFAPIFKKRGKKAKKTLRITTSVEDLFTKASEGEHRNYIKIKYRDQYGNFTIRTISQYEIISGEDFEESTERLVKYIKAYCHLRNSDRHFKLTNILEAYELNLPINR
ncbi:MAG: hypothetical protein ABIN80_09390 [Dyadobacter sp.]|uniref:hypothetical protein n=1 Tax=Dyadobacter sp. TaxID=1914288 RepID=UPI0032665199